MKTEELVADVTPLESPDRPECGIIGMVVLVGEPLGDVGIPSCALIPLLSPI